jgi:hypothetical protein
MLFCYPLLLVSSLFALSVTFLGCFLSGRASEAGAFVKVVGLLVDAVIIHVALPRVLFRATLRKSSLFRTGYARDHHHC